MRVIDSGDSILLWASARDTDDWATKPGAAWPCSTLRGKRIFAAFDSNGLYELTVNGKRPSELDGYELSACAADLIEESGKVTADNTAYFVAVGQFREGAESSAK